jgi:hypothetical protein
VDADLDTLLIALYVELDDRIIPAHRSGRGRRGPGRPPLVTDAELVCLAVAQVLLRYHDERHWLRAAPARVGHLFPRLLKQSEYNQRLKRAAPLLQTATRWLAAHTPSTAELLRLLDGTPVGCGQSKLTTKRSDLFGWAGTGYDCSHSRWYWGVKLMLITTVDGTVTGFGLANPKLVGERAQTRAMLTEQPANQPTPAPSWSATRDCPAPTTTPSSPTWTCSCSARPTATRPGPGRPRLATPTHRSDHLHPQTPTRPRTPPRPRPGRAMDPDRAAPARPQHRHLAQLDHRRTRQTVIDRLRSLTPPDQHRNTGQRSRSRGGGAGQRACRSSLAVLLPRR